MGEPALLFRLTTVEVEADLLMTALLVLTVLEGRGWVGVVLTSVGAGGGSVGASMGCN